MTEKKIERINHALQRKRILFAVQKLLFLCLLPLVLAGASYTAWGHPAGLAVVFLWVTFTAAVFLLSAAGRFFFYRNTLPNLLCGIYSEWPHTLIQTVRRKGGEKWSVCGAVRFEKSRVQAVLYYRIAVLRKLKKNFYPYAESPFHYIVKQELNASVSLPASQLPAFRLHIASRKKRAPAPQEQNTAEKAEFSPMALEWTEEQHKIMEDKFCRHFSVVAREMQAADRFLTPQRQKYLLDLEEQIGSFRLTCDGGRCCLQVNDFAPLGKNVKIKDGVPTQLDPHALEESRRQLERVLDVLAQLQNQLSS